MVGLSVAHEVTSMRGCGCFSALHRRSAVANQVLKRIRATEFECPGIDYAHPLLVCLLVLGFGTRL